MKNLYIILIITISTLSYGQNMSVGVSTPDGELTLNINYTANAAYATPFSIWNNQVVSLRWPTSAGTNVIASVASPTTLSYNADGAPADGGDGFYYQKIISSSVNQNIPFSAGETKIMATITLVSNGDGPAIDIEVLDGTNTWVSENAGGPFLNNIVGNQFDALGNTSANVLPIKLNRFTAAKEDKNVNLDWSTSSEINGSHFDVQRSRDLSSWVTIGTVDAVGESTTVQEYQLVDKDLPLSTRSSKTFYYRLNMVDNDGSSEMSEIRTVRFDQDGADFIVYPNPSINEVFVNLSSITTETGPATMHVINMKGERVKEVTLSTNDDVSVNVSNITAGMYYFIVRQGEETFSQKVIKID